MHIIARLAPPHVGTSVPVHTPSEASQVGARRVLYFRSPIPGDRSWQEEIR
jgi:hypothetical protein